MYSICILSVHNLHLMDAVQVFVSKAGAFHFNPTVCPLATIIVQFEVII